MARVLDCGCDDGNFKGNVSSLLGRFVKIGRGWDSENGRIFKRGYPVNTWKFYPN